MGWRDDSNETECSGKMMDNKIIFQQPGRKEFFMILS